MGQTHPLERTAAVEQTQTAGGPVSGAQRIQAIDVLRGVALLGILVMNIRTFAMIEAAYFFPTAYGDLTGGNLVVWWLGDLLANRKFMTLFSLLFGAGVILQAARAEGAGRSFKGFYYRRLFWLWIIGLVHAYVFWEGDILVTYAVAGLLLYPMRNLKPRTLLIVGLLVLAVGSVLSLGSGLSAAYWDEAQVANFRAEWQPDAAQVASQLEAYRGNWIQEIRHRFPSVLEMHFFVIPFHLFWRALGVMLMGMALYKWGLLDGTRLKAYRIWLILGIVVGLPVTAWGALRQFASGWEPISAFLVDTQFGYWASLLVALGWAGLVFLTLAAGRVPWLTTRLAAVGRMALTNYLMQTVLCSFIFYGRGLGLFGHVSRMGQLGIVVLVWIVQLLWSAWWLERFRFGPAEWLWRSLSYWRRQPMRR